MNTVGKGDRCENTTSWEIKNRRAERNYEMTYGLSRLHDRWSSSGILSSVLIKTMFNANINNKKERNILL